MMSDKQVEPNFRVFQPQETDHLYHLPVENFVIDGSLNSACNQ